MKFLYADSLDYVDPRYDFEKDQSPLDREPYWDDVYPHEILGYAPYDGLLVSRATVDGYGGAGKYSHAMSMRFRLVGARKFLRFDTPEFIDRPIFGDCGAFSYVNEEIPPYTAENMIEFYEDGDFTHGLSVDHIIYDYIPNAKSFWEGIDYENRENDVRYKRYRLTLDLADEFISICKSRKVNFEPVGVIQGWSQESMAHAAKTLANMGYRYLAVGGMVPRKPAEIHTALKAIHAELEDYPHIKLHILGFAKADHLEEFAAPGIYPKLASIDTTSPLLRAFKDSRRNYFLPTNDGKIKYYAAIRIPQVNENNTLQRAIKKGIYKTESLISLEKDALKTIREYDQDNASISQTLDAILTYSRTLVVEGFSPTTADEKKLSQLNSLYKTTLLDKPWKRCDCPICNEISVEAIIFRGSNRNKRRGIHNLHVFYQHLKNIR